MSTEKDNLEDPLHVYYRTLDLQPGRALACLNISLFRLKKRSYVCVYAENAYTHTYIYMVYICIYVHVFNSKRIISRNIVQRV